MIEIVISGLSAATALGTLAFTVVQWRRINRKIAMLNDSGAAAEIVPAWYTQRMMDDSWWFGLQMADGKVVAMSKILSISDDGQWMDVEPLAPDDLPRRDDVAQFVCAVADDRRGASLRIDKIVAAYDLVTS